ncbi:MAG: hypothetical protein LBE39_03310 [Flavobacteriaceae bacterium]|jgi:hypothetical protein|nr:hypothetical protein [Elizabethkingia ursingii]MDR2228476.1 hypothetical protein [Flavobacteriaceae bacterium]
MKILSLISILSYLLVGIPSENGSFIFVLLFFMAINSFNSILYGTFFSLENLGSTGIMLLVLGALICLNFSKNKYLKIVCYIVLCLQLIYSLSMADYSFYKVEGSNIIFIIIMPLLFVLSSYFVAFNKNIFKKKE